MGLINPKALWHQANTLIKVFLVIYIPSIALVGTLFIIYLGTGIPFGCFFEDPMNIPAYRGLVSNIGVLLFCASAAICWFSSAVVRSQDKNREKPLFLLFLGVITLLLTIDDFFMIHEAVGDYFAAAYGISDDVGEAAVFTMYALLFLGLVIRFRRTILQTEYVLLVCALAFFGLSTVYDQISLVISPEDISGAAGVLSWKVIRIGDDVFKLFGIVSWVAYVTRTALKCITTKP